MRRLALDVFVDTLCLIKSALISMCLSCPPDTRVSVQLCIAHSRSIGNHQDLMAFCCL